MLAPSVNCEQGVRQYYGEAVLYDIRRKLLEAIDGYSEGVVDSDDTSSELTYEPISRRQYE